MPFTKMLSNLIDLIISARVDGKINQVDLSMYIGMYVFGCLTQTNQYEWHYKVCEQPNTMRGIQWCL